MDFGVEIVGENEPRPLPVDTHDQGIAEEPEGLDQTPEGINLSLIHISEPTRRAGRPRKDY